MTARGYTVESIATIGLTYAPELEGFYTLSPFVWRDGDAYRLLLRMVNRAHDPHAKVARIHAGTSYDGLTFALDPQPCIAPSPGSPDSGGCEDPTVIVSPGRLIVYYSGWNDATERGELLAACGPDTAALIKTGIAIPWSDAYKNPKEATVVACADGTWAMFFEYAATGSSLIGIARSSDPGGPWRIDEQFVFERRAGSWDAFHLSPGPIAGTADRPVMFYNGSGTDANWRIGWAAFDRNFTRVVERGAGPVIVPPSPEGDETDIAFAASALTGGDTIEIYYSVADKALKRATLRAQR